MILIILIINLIFPFIPSSSITFAKESAGNSGYVLIESSSKRVLKSSNEHIRLPIASTTKIMTALVVLENADLNALVTIPKEAVSIEGSSIYLKEGEKVKVKDLLYGLMLRSGNDAAVALAIHTGGSVQKFVKLMNERANSMGLKNTSFQNPHGLPAKGHYSSAYDLSIITAEGFKNDTFKQIVSTKSYNTNSDNPEEIRYFRNKNRILYNYEGATGVKTGYTKEAGRCLVSSSERNGMEVIAVALNYYDYFDLCAKLMDYGHENYQLVKVLDKEKAYASVKVKKGKRLKKADLFVLDDHYYPLKKDGSEQFKVEILPCNEIVAPHNKENSCGEVKICLGNDLIFSEKLYTIYNIEKKFISIF